MTGQVLRGAVLGGHVRSTRGDGSRASTSGPGRAAAASRPGPSTGMVILAREASRRNGQREQDRIGLLERIGERLAGSLEIGTDAQPGRGDAGAAVRRPLLHRPVPGRPAVPACQRHASELGAAAGDLGRGRRAGSLPGGPLLPAGDEPAGTDRSSRTWTASTTRRPAREHVGGAPGRDDLGDRRAAATPAGELLGVMSLALSRLTERARPALRRLRPGLIGAIASRVALAIDNAMLFEEERHTALAFQKSLLPAGLPELDGLEIACRYVPAKPLESHGQGIQTQVGGDWYDVIPLSAGPGRDRHRRRRGPGGAGRRDHGPAARGAARVRPGRQVARRHPAQARRVVPARWPRPTSMASRVGDPPTV